MGSLVVEPENERELDKALDELRSVMTCLFINNVFIDCPWFVVETRGNDISMLLLHKDFWCYIKPYTTDIYRLYRDSSTYNENVVNSILITVRASGTNEHKSLMMESRTIKRIHGLLMNKEIEFNEKVKPHVIRSYTKILTDVLSAVKGKTK